MTNKEFLSKKAAEVHAAIISAEPTTLADLAACIGTIWPAFELSPVLYFGTFQGYRVTLTDRTGNRKQCNPKGTAYAAFCPAIDIYL